MPNLTLYYSPNSCALVPHALLHHLSLPFSPIQIARGADGLEAADGSFSAKWYRDNIHHAGYVPALKVGDGEVITEMPAILTYIALSASASSGEALLGKGVLERARVAEWLAWLAGTVHGNGFAMLFRPGRFSADISTHSSIKEQGEKVVKGCFQRIEKRLSGREFAVGDALTLVDLNVYVFARWWVEFLGKDLNESYPQYGRFCRGVEGLEGVRKAVGEHGKELLFQ